MSSKVSSAPTRVRRWRRWSVDEGRMAVETWKASGETLAEYARTAGVSPERLRRWATRVGTEAVAHELVPVVVRPTPIFAPIVVHLTGDVTVELADANSASAEWLVAIATALGKARG